MLTIEFDGADFSGWQRQPALRTVQGDLEDALKRIIQQPVKVIGAGRTDVGVHALGQVANVALESDLPLNKIRHSLNGVLSPDVRIRDIAEADLSFNARFDAVAREYVYRISAHDIAIGRQYVWYSKHQLDAGAMEEATAVLQGTHDFSAYCKANEALPHTECTINRIGWREVDDELRFTISANRFLHKMVRSIVGTAVEVGRGKCAPDAMRDILESCDRNRVGPTAPAHGLCLMKVSYRGSFEHQP